MSTRKPSRPCLALVALIALTSRAEPPNDPPLGMLPATVQPTAYGIEFTLLPESDGFSARTAISITLRERAQLIWLHGDHLEVAAAHAIDSRGRRIGAHYRQVDEAGVAALTLDEPLEPGDATLHFEHVAPYRTNGYGGGVSRMSAAGHHYLATMMFAVEARRVFPCFDEPRFKTPFEVTIVTREDQVAIANARETGSEWLGGGMKRVRFAPTRPIATYLVGFWVGDYESRLAGPLRGFAESGRGPELHYALQRAPAIVRTLADYVGAAYPFDKLDLIAIPDPHERGGMENAAAPSFGAHDLLVGDLEPLVERRHADYLLAHEIAHQWFGNLVTPAWWSDFWINEAFATWLGHRVTAHLAPGRDFERMSQRWSIAEMDIDSRPDARAIRPIIRTTADMSAGLNPLMYAKGNGVLAMFEHYVGPPAFQRGIQLYFRRYSDRAIDSDEFLDALESGSESPSLGNAVRSFLDQPGVPLLQVDWTCNAHSLQIDVAQSRYVLHGSAVDARQRWQLPFCVSHGDGAERETHCALLRNAHDRVRFPVRTCPQTLMPNAAGAGYYRFELPREEFLDLTSQAGKLDGAEALALADSFGAAFAAGRLTVADYGEAARRFAAHPAWDVAVAPLPKLRLILDHLVAGHAKAATRRWIRDAYAPVLRSLETRPADEAAQLRPLLVPFLALHARHAPLRARLAAEGEAWLSQGASSADPQLLRASLTVAAQERGAPFVAVLEKSLRGSRDPDWRGAVLVALGGVDDPTLAARARDLALLPEFSAGEIAALLGAQSDNADQLAAHWSWQKAHLEQLEPRMKGYYRRALIAQSGRQCDLGIRGEVRTAFASWVAGDPAAGVALETALDGISHCAALVADQR